MDEEASKFSLGVMKNEEVRTGSNIRGERVTITEKEALETNITRIRATFINIYLPFYFREKGFEVTHGSFSQGL